MGQLKRKSKSESNSNSVLNKKNKKKVKKVKKVKNPRDSKGLNIDDLFGKLRESKKSAKATALSANSKAIKKDKSKVIPRKTAPRKKKGKGGR